jgi:hypothetical protein
MGFANLHTHTYFSDGRTSPEELVRHIYNEKGLETFALTDHDTLSGIEPAYRTKKRIESESGCRKKEKRFIPGIELSLHHKGIGRAVHLIGLFPIINENNTKIELKRIDHVLGPFCRYRSKHRALKDLERVSHSHKSLARIVGRLLTQCCEDEDLLRGKKRFSETADLDPQSPREGAKSRPDHLNSTGAAAIITFYSYGIQMLLRDLESEIGAQAHDLYRDIVTRSEYYDIFFSQLDINDGVSANVHRIREHIGAQRHTFGKQDMVRAFQQVLLALIEEENRLLGDKAVQMSLGKLKEYMAGPAQKNYPTLADHLIAFLENRTIWKRV